MGASERPRDSVDEFARGLASIAVIKTNKIAEESLTFEEKVMERFDQLDDKLTTVDTRITTVDEQLTKVDSRLTGVEKHMRWMVVAIACSIIIGVATFAILVFGRL